MAGRCPSATQAHGSRLQCGNGLAVVCSTECYGELSSHLELNVLGWKLLGLCTAEMTASVGSGGLGSAFCSSCGRRGGAPGLILCRGGNSAPACTGGWRGTDPQGMLKTVLEGPW